jgi:tetratricopeptide (TPR) repeat protein
MTDCGKCCINFRRNKDALKDFDEAIRLDPTLSIAYYGRGSYYISQERYDDALEEMNAAIKYNELDAMAYFSRGEIFRMQKRYKNALRDLTEAIQLDPLHETACRGRAEVHRAEGRYAEAIADLQKALDIEPSLHELVEQRIEDIEDQIKDEQVKTLIESGVSQMQQGNDERALEDFTQATEIKPECAEAFSSLGTINHKMGRLDTALRFHEQARVIEPKYGGAYFGRAQVYHSQGRYQEALSDYQTAMRMRPDMQWQIDPYLVDVQTKFKEKAAAAEAELLAELEEEEQKEISKKSKNRKKKQKQKAKQKAKKESDVKEREEEETLREEQEQEALRKKESAQRAAADAAAQKKADAKKQKRQKQKAKKALEQDLGEQSPPPRQDSEASAAHSGAGGAGVPSGEGMTAAEKMAEMMAGGDFDDEVPDDDITRLMRQMGWKGEEAEMDADEPDFLTEEEIAQTKAAATMPPVLKAFPISLLSGALDEATLAGTLSPKQVLTRAGLERFVHIFEREGIATYEVRRMSPTTAACLLLIDSDATLYALRGTASLRTSTWIERTSLGTARARRSHDEGAWLKHGGADQIGEGTSSHTTGSV